MYPFLPNFYGCLNMEASKDHMTPFGKRNLQTMLMTSKAGFRKGCLFYSKEHNQTMHSLLQTHRTHGLKNKNKSRDAKQEYMSPLAKINGPRILFDLGKGHNSVAAHVPCTHDVRPRFIQGNSSFARLSPKTLERNSLS